MFDEVSQDRAQLDWLTQATRRVPLPENEIREHLAPALLEAVGGPEGFNGAMATVGSFAVSDVQPIRVGGLQAVLSGADTQWVARLRADEAGRIGNLLVTLHQPSPESWEEIDTRLAGLAARVSFAASEIVPDGSCQLVHGVDAETPRPIGSTFKLYVLGALGRAVAQGRADWGEQLAIRDDWKSLPSGVLQDRSEGEMLSLAEFADPMMEISDNTATDHLIHRLGRDAVERELALLGNRHPNANIPFLTTRAMFQFKCGADPTAVDRYLALPPEGRRAMLEEMERLRLPQLQKAWPEPRHLDDIEWFASATDICRAYAGLLQLDQPQIDHALTRNDEGLTLDETRFPTVWSKPGSEPGVLCLSYLARTATGRTLVTSLSLSDPAPTAGDLKRSWDLTLSVIRGAFDLLEASEPL